MEATEMTDIENSAGISTEPIAGSYSTIFGVPEDDPYRATEADRHRAMQGIFLCLENTRQEQYAVLVPCSRPRTETVMSRTINITEGSPRPSTSYTVTYKNPRPLETTGESDTDIYMRLVDKCYSCQGRWKRWLPYFGVTAVQEVNFLFAGTVERDGRYPITMKTPDIEEIERECHQTADSNTPHREQQGVSYLEECGGNYHTDACTNMIDYEDEGLAGYGWVCRHELYLGAQRRLHNIQFSKSLLMTCATDPSRANGLHTLEGMVQSTPIYQIKGLGAVRVPLPYERFDKHMTWLRGLHFTLGWQIDRMKLELPSRVLTVWLGIAVIWLCVILGKGVGADWGTAFAFAQVAAASLSLLIAVTRH